MDFHGLPRRTLQSLCKKNGIAANLSNVAMAESLASLPKVEGLDEAAAATASPPRTPTTTAKPVPLRPPNPPRSCRRSSVLPLLQDDSFFKKKGAGIEKTPLSACVVSKKKRSVAALLFPFSERGVIDEMPVRKEARGGPKREVFVSDEMRVRGGGTGVGDYEVRKDVKEEVASVVTRETGECFNESVVLPSSAELVVEQCLKNAVFVSQPREGSGDMDAEMMGDEEEDAGNGRSFSLDEAVGLPNHAESVEEQGLKNVGFVSDDMEEGEGENHTRASEDCLDEVVAIQEDQGLENAVVSASEEMAIGGEGSEDKDVDTLEDEKGGEEANGDTFYTQDKMTLVGTDSTSSSRQLEEEGLRNLDSVSEDKEEGEEVNLTQASGDCLDESVVIIEDQCLNKDKEEGEEVNLTRASGECLDEAVVIIEDQRLNNVVFASEEMAVRGEVEDKDADMLEEEKGGEEASEESFCGQIDLNCVDYGVWVLCSQPSVCMLKGREEELLQGSSLGGIESSEQEDCLKDDGVHHDLGEVEERGLKNEDISSAEPCASGERNENKGGVKENGVSFSGKSDVTCANGGCLDETVRLGSSQELVTMVKDQEYVFLQSPSSGGLGSDKQNQGLKDGVHHVLIGEVDNKGLKDAEFESEEVLVSGERSEDMDAEVMKDNKGAAWADNRVIQIGASDLENNVGEDELPAIGDQISTLGSEAKNPISASDDCACNAVSVVRDQKCGLLQQVLRGEMEKQVIEQDMQNTLNETCEMPVMRKVKDIDAENRSSIAIQVNITDYATSNQVTPLHSNANGGTIHPHTDSISTIGEDNSTIPEYEKAVNSTDPIPATEDLHQKSPPTSKTIDSSCCPDLIKKENNFSSSPLVTATFLEKEVTQSSSPQVVRQIGNSPCSGSLEPSYKPSEVGEEKGVQQSTSTSSIKESNSGVKGPEMHSDNTVLEKGEGEKRDFVEGTDLDKDTKEAMKQEGASKKRSAKKADLSSLSLRKLKVLYKENKQVGKLDIKSKLESKNGSAEMKMKDEQSAEKTGLGVLSLRRLKLMYKHKVANDNRT